ncbi:MAG TPA: hypothetical protein VKE50_00230 [Thermoanaerobaculia bacterium]|nr:hypothetical protein [Thermoanaerobaculia bacterium]
MDRSTPGVPRVNLSARLAFVLIATAGLALYLWGAFRAPVVLWSDSRIDMDWAREGAGIFKPIPPPPSGEPLGHPPKSGYLLFLRLAMQAAPPRGEARSVVLVQSLLLWASIAGSGWFLGRRLGPGAGAAAAILLFAVLRIRDAASAVMSEAVSAAIFLPLAILAVWPPSRTAALAAAGAGAAVLFAIRPDFGAILFLLAAAALLAEKRWRSLAGYAAGFVAVASLTWIATRSASGPDPLRGAGHPILEASAEYYWRPALPDWPRASEAEMGRRELELAAENWKKRLGTLDSDGRRELVWRAFHGWLGTEYYEAEWSRAYRTIDTASRVVTPFLLLAALAALALPLPAAAARLSLATLLALGCFTVHNLVFGSNPRYLAPLLPFLVLPLAAAGASWRAMPGPRRAVGLLLFVLLLCGAFWQRQILDWQWGKIESAGVTIRQPIGQGALPARGPATLHVRIAPPLVPSNAQIALSARGRELWSSAVQLDRRRLVITVELPDWLLEADARGPIELVLTSAGDYGRFSYVLFPVIPPPWGRMAHRDGGELSPATFVSRGALDWWAHTGNDPRPESTRAGAWR